MIHLTQTRPTPTRLASSRLSLPALLLGTALAAVCTLPAPALPAPVPAAPVPVDAPALPAGRGMTRADTSEATGALTGPLVDAAAEGLGAELAQGVEALSDPEAILAHCRARIAATRAPAGAPLAAAALSACETRAAVPLRAAVEAVIARDLAVLEAAPETLDGLLATDGYALAPGIEAWLSRPDAAKALAPLRATLAEARAAMTARRQAVIAAEARALDARGGLFSRPRHDLTLQIGTGDAALALTGRLQAPEADTSSGEAGKDAWHLTGITVTPGRLAEGLDPDAPDTLRRCLGNPASCTE